MVSRLVVGAHYGLRDWIAQRATAVVMAGYSLWLGVWVLVDPPQNYGAWKTMIGTGWVASAGAHIFLGAEKENRFCLPNTRFLLHQPLGGVAGQASDITIEAEEIVKMRERLNRIIARETGQTFDKIVADTDRNFWIQAEDAVGYGLVSRVVSRTDEV